MGDETWVNIVYTGTIYEKNQDPTKLFQALAELIRDGEVERELVSIDIYGGYSAWIEKEIKKFGLIGVAKQLGRVSEEEAREKQRSARILWMMKWEGLVTEYGFIFRAFCRLMRDKELLEYAREFNKKFGGKPEDGLHLGKLFDYIAARRPIMATGGHKDVVNEVLDDIKTGACCETVKEIKRFILDIY